MTDVRRIQRKLDAHVLQFLDGAPWMPFQQTLGISGHETSFAHPDELFYTLALAVPVLPGPTATRVREFLRKELAILPPYAETGYDPRAGRPRESHEFPMELRRSGRLEAGSVFGVYSLWACAHFAGDTNAAVAHWPAVKARVRPLLESAYRFDPRARSAGRAESEKLNGDIAGLIGFMRLARINGDESADRAAGRRCRELMEFRINLDRVNPNLLEPSRAASRSLHNARLARHGHLVPELAEAIATRTGGCAAQNLRAFREQRPAWNLAHGDRFVGGENFTSPAHFPWALYTGAALIEKLPAPQLASLVDVPWCAGDFYFMQNCTLALWAAAGRPWDNLQDPKDETSR